MIDHYFLYSGLHILGDIGASLDHASLCLWMLSEIEGLYVLCIWKNYGFVLADVKDKSDQQEFESRLGWRTYAFSAKPSSIT